MKKPFKKLLVGALSVVLAMVLATTVFAAKTSDEKNKETSEFGRFTATLDYIGFVADRKNVTFETTIEHLSTSHIDTKLYAQVIVYNYNTGERLDEDRAPVTTNELTTSYYWEGHTSVTNDNKISVSGSHEARSYGSVAAYTTIYDF